MRSRSTHVIPTDGGWVIRKEGSAPSARVYSSQKEAVAAARRMAERASVSQVVVHGLDGSFRTRYRRGLPRRRPVPYKSSIGTETINKAVSAVIRERLLGA